MTNSLQLEFFESTQPKVVQGCCLDVMKDMQENSIDFIVTDPPYGISFMSKKWDQQIPPIEYWQEMLRICKPGSMMACAGLPRMYHRLACVVEDAGWKIRDCIMHIFGSGFPKSHNKFGFDGYGTALKPAYEPWLLCMKPLDGTFAQNAEKWGVAGLNIDDSRIPMQTEDFDKYKEKRKSFDSLKGKILPGFCTSPFENKIETKGRWPANIIFDEESAAELDKMTSDLKSGHRDRSKHRVNDRDTIFKIPNPIANFKDYADSGGASRFFYCAKASRSERNEGLGENKCTHPTVKPISLMKYIIKLLAPPGNPILLDPFCGSGSTLVAAKDLGISAIGIEKEQEYCEIAKARIA